MIPSLWLVSVLFHYFLECHLQLKNLHMYNNNTMYDKYGDKI